jgi:ElaB/YqjD/DUF883 family membrane-anchored ribosome-binding protein
VVMLSTPTSKNRTRSNRIHSSATREFRDQAAVIRKDAWHLAETAGAVAREQLDPLRASVTEKPFQSLLVAGGLGLFLGLILARR